MPNNSVAFEPNYSDSLKARFCKQYIPRLKEFLTDFDISQTSEDEDPKDSLGMGFLVKAYNEMENREQAPQLKANCKWKIESVTEKEIYEAIEEFYAITAWKDEIDKKGYNSKLKINEKETESNSVCGQRDKLLEFLFQLKIEDRQANIADTTMFAIADYYGIRNNAKQLGNLYQPYEAVAYAYDLQKEENKDGLYDFRNVLRLFPNLRNAIVHQDYDLKKKIRYHEFIIFTYIGYVLVCRRIWKAFNFEKITTTQQSFDKKKKKLCRDDHPSDFFCPNNPKLFTLPKESVEINIGSGPNIDVSCKDKYGNAIDVTTISKDDNRYSISISRYKKFTITISDGIHEPLFIEDELDYNAWFYCYKVNLPKEWYPSSKDYETLSEGTRHLIASVSKYVKEGVREDIKECIKQQFADLQPLINNVVEDGKRTEELNNILEKLTLFSNGYGKIEEIQSLIKESNQTIFEELKTISSRIDGLQNEISTISGDIKTANDNAQKAGDEGEKINKTLSNWGRNIKLGLFIVLVLLPIVYAGYNFFVNNIESNICWLRHKILYWTLVPILICLTFGLTNSWNSIKNIKKEKGKLNYWVTSVIALVLFGSPFFLRYQNVTFLVNNYDFAGNKEEDNQEVVSFLEESMGKSEDVSVISKLFSYYQLYGNNAEKANSLWTRISENAKKHPEEVIKAAVIFLATGDNVKLKNAIDVCPQKYKDTSVVVMRLNGIMMAGGYGVDKKLEKGLELLDKASSKGDLEATYWLGHIASTIDFQEWNETESSIKTFMRYDILLAINQLRKASVLPKAAIELGNIYTDLNMNDSAEYYYLKALSIDENSLEAKYQIGRLYDKMGKDDNQYMLEAISRSYAPAMLYKAERDSDHTSAIELYKLFDDSVKAKRYDKKYREDYRYIRPIVFEYVAAHNSGVFNGIDSAYNYLQKSRPNGHFNIEFVKGIRAIISADSSTKQNSWILFRESADKGCLYAQMMCHYKDIMQILRSGEKGEKMPLAEINTIDHKLDSLEDIGNEIPFSNVLLSCISGLSEKGLDDSEQYAHKALIRGHLAGIIALSRNAFYYNNLINEIIPTWDDEHPKPLSEPIQFNQITGKNLHMAKGFWISTQLGLRYSPISANKMGFISLGADLSEIIDYAYKPQKEYPIESFHFWCDVAIANHDYVNECNFLKRIIRTFLQKGGQMNEDACRYLTEEPYTTKLIRAASLDMSKFPKPTYRQFLTSSIKIYERLTGHYDHPNDSIPIYIKPTVRFASMPVLYGQYEDYDILYECSDWFSPYGSKMFDSRLKNLPKEQIIDFYGYDIFE